jgi:hypothetical protein
VKPNDVPRQHPNAAWREVDGAVVIISPEDSVLHELNETASLVWKEADGTRTSQEIAQRLAEEFEVEEATALADTCELVSHLEQKKLLICAKAGA